MEYPNPNQVTYPVAPYVAQQRPKIPLNFEKRDYVFAILFALASALLAFIGITERMALGYTVSHIAFLAVFAAYLLKNGKLNVLSLFSLIASALSSVIVHSVGGGVGVGVGSGVGSGVGAGSGVSAAAAAPSGRMAQAGSRRTRQSRSTRQRSRFIV